jgi:hypothetical protein
VNGTFNKSDPVIHFQMPNRSQSSIEYLLTYIQMSVVAFNFKHPKRVFDISGGEVLTLNELHTGQHLFISFGEDYQTSLGRNHRTLSFDGIDTSYAFRCLLGNCSSFFVDDQDA